MKTHIKFYLITLLFFLKISYICQTNNDSVIKMPNIFPRIMFDASYSNSQLFFNNPDVVNYSGGDVILNLKNDFEINALGLFMRNFSGNHHKLYGGIGANYSEYAVKRHIFKDPSYPSSHFGKYYVFNPNQLNYNIQILTFNLQLCHYTFYKRVVLFQKIGLTYSSFIKKSSSDAQYIEQYGNSYPTMDSTYITTNNPDGWHFVNSYTILKKTIWIYTKILLVPFINLVWGLESNNSPLLRLSSFRPYPLSLEVLI